MSTIKLQNTPSTQDETILAKSVSCTVKWFSLKKGYGFLEPIEENGMDIFMHFSVLEKAGYQHVCSGDTLVCDIGAGKAGPQVLAIEHIECASGEPSEIRLVLEEKIGTVKWFNMVRGYGFIQAEDGGADIFVHAGMLKHTGADRLMAGQRLQMKILSTERGREARDIRFIDEAESKAS